MIADEPGKKEKLKKIKKPKKSKPIFFILGVIMALIGFINLGTAITISNSNNRTERVEHWVNFNETQQSIAMPVYVTEIANEMGEDYISVNTFDITEIDSLDINLTMAVLSILPSDSFELKISPDIFKRIEIEELDGCLKITENDYFINKDMMNEVLLFMPVKHLESIRINGNYTSIMSDIELNADAIVISNTHSDMVLNALKAEDIIIRSGYGNLTIENEIISDNTVSISSLGNITTNAIKTKNLEITGTNGNLQSGDIYTKDLQIKLGSGQSEFASIYATNVNIDSNYCNFFVYEDLISDNLNIVSSSGNITLSRLNAKNTEITVEYGNCDVYFPSDAYVELDVENKYGQFINNMANESYMNRSDKIMNFKFRSDFSNLSIGNY